MVNRNDYFYKLRIVTTYPFAHFYKGEVPYELFR